MAGGNNSSLKTPPGHLVNTRILYCYNYRSRLMYGCMTLTFSNTVLKNCDNILVLLPTDQFIIQNDGGYIIEIIHVLS